MKYIEKNSLYCSLVKDHLLLKNPQVRRLPNLSSPTVARLPRQVGPPLSANDLMNTNSLVLGDVPLSISPECELRDFLNEYLGRFFHLEGGFFDYYEKYNNLYKLYIHNKALQFENFQKLDFFFERFNNSNFSRVVNQEIQASLIERQKNHLISLENIYNYKSMNVLAAQTEGQIEAQNAAWVGEANQRYHQPIQAELAAQLQRDQQAEFLGELDRMRLSLDIDYLDINNQTFKGPLSGLPNGGLRSVPLSHPTNAKGYILSSGGGSSGGKGGNNGFWGDGDSFGDDPFNANGGSPMILFFVVVFYFVCLVVIIIVLQKVSSRCLSVCRRLRQSLQRWHRKKRRRKILKWLLRIYAWLLMSVPLLMAIPAGEAFFLDTMEALGIPAAFRFLRWFCRLLRYSMFLVLFLKSTGMGLGFLQYAYKAIEPIIGEISKYIAMSGQASPQIFLSKLLQWFFLVQLGFFIDIFVQKKKYFYIFFASLMVLICVFRMSPMFLNLGSLALNRVPELSLLTSCQAGRLLCLGSVVLILKRQRVGYISTLFFVVFLYYYRLYQMVFLGLVPLFPNSLK